MKASLPVPDIQATPSVTASYSRKTGVQFIFPQGQAGEVHAIFDSFMYWIPGGAPASNPILPNFQPTFDSIILKSSVVISPDIPVCAPFPAFITYENIDQTSIENQAISLVKKLFPNYSDADVQQIVDVDFFKNNKPIICNSGDLLGTPKPLAAGGVPASNGFWLRTWESNGNELIYAHVYLHHLSEIDSTINPANVIASNLQYGISDSVGEGGTNDPDDVYLVKQRFSDLGFNYVPFLDPDHETVANPNYSQPSKFTVDNNPNDDLTNMIMLFQAIIHGYSSISIENPPGTWTIRNGIDGLISKNQLTEHWLWAGNVPTWSKLDAGGCDPNNSQGYKNVNTDDKDYGTNFLRKAIVDAGRYYIDNYWSSLSQTKQKNCDVIPTNYASYKQGGYTNAHKGHQTGLDIDISLPHQDGGYGWDEQNWGLPWNSMTGSNIPTYDQTVTIAIIKSFLSLGTTSDNTGIIHHIFFNDPDLYQIKTGSQNQNGPKVIPGVQWMNKHNDHIHVDIIPPSEPAPDYSPP